MDTTTLESITQVKKYRHNHDNVKHTGNRLNFLDAEGKYQDGRTKQCHKDECDINNVVKKYDTSGIITHVNSAIAHYGDYSEINEYQESLNIVIDSEKAFMDLPSDLRKRFHNDAGEYLEFATNPANIAELIELGMAEKPEVIAPIEVINVTPEIEKTE